MVKSLQNIIEVPITKEEIYNYEIESIIYGGDKVCDLSSVDKINEEMQRIKQNLVNIYDFIEKHYDALKINIDDHYGLGDAINIIGSLKFK